MEIRAKENGPRSENLVVKESLFSHSKCPSLSWWSLEYSALAPRKHQDTFPNRRACFCYINMLISIMLARS